MRRETQIATPKNRDRRSHFASRSLQLIILGAFLVNYNHFLAFASRDARFGTFACVLLRKLFNLKSATARTGKKGLERVESECDAMWVKDILHLKALLRREKN